MSIEHGPARQKSSRPKRYLREPDLRERYGVGRTTIWRWVKTGNLPPPVRLGPNVVGWAEEKLDERDEKLDAA